jgi:hypothetical protein
MRKTTKLIAATMLALAALTLTADAQSQSIGGACTRALANVSMPVKNAACNGSTGYCGCGPGWISACAPRCCRCVPC